MALPPVVPIADADAYFATTPRDAEWTAVTDKQIWLNESYRWLAQLCMDDTRQCCGMSFADAWTVANSELALALSKSPGAIIGGPSAGGTTGAIKEQKLGDLMQSFYDVKDGSVSASRFGPNDPLVLQRFPWIYDIIGCYLNVTKSSGTRVIARVRS